MDANTINEETILREYHRVWGLRPGSEEKYNSAKRLNHTLAVNPKVVADIAFDDSIDLMVRENILFIWSTEPIGSCAVEDNPNWAKMMRDLIIPEAHRLPEHFQQSIKWYLDVHGL